MWAPGVRQLTGGLVMTVTLVAFESLSVATILPVVSRQLGDLRLYGWVFSAFFLSSLVGIVVSGALSDRRGIGPPLIGGLVIFAAGLAIAGTATNMPVLVAGRVVQGFGAGTVPAAAYAAIGRAYPSRVQPKHVRHAVDGMGCARFARAGSRRPGRQPSRLALGLPRPAATGGHLLRGDRPVARRVPAATSPMTPPCPPRPRCWSRWAPACSWPG